MRCSIQWITAALFFDDGGKLVGGGSGCAFAPHGCPIGTRCEWCEFAPGHSCEPVRPQCDEGSKGCEWCEHTLVRARCEWGFITVAGCEHLRAVPMPLAGGRIPSHH